MTQLIILCIFLALGYYFGSLAEKKHYRSILEREDLLNSLPALASKMPPVDGRYQQVMVVGNTVVANDYFKSFVARLQGIFGGRLTTYETMIDRARRESLLRMKEEAQDIDAAYVFNVKYETSSISGRQGKGVGSVEVLAYGTALVKR
jgi:Uncharacterized conserved protein